MKFNTLNCLSISFLFDSVFSFDRISPHAIDLHSKKFESQEPLLLKPNKPSLAANESSFYPLLPPAIPLAVVSPYLSAWLATGKEGGNGGYLAGRWAQFWPIQFPPSPHNYRLGWAGLIRINGLTYEFMGRPNDDYIGNRHQRAVQRGFRYTSTRSIFEFEAGGVAFLVTFLSPIGQKGDLVRQTLPFSYMSVELVDQGHLNRVQDEIVVYTDIQADWASGDHSVGAIWSLQSTNQSLSYHVSRKDPLKFSEQAEYPEWGEAIYATLNVDGLTTASGVAAEIRSQFVAHGQLDNNQDKNYRKISDRTAAFGFSVPIQHGARPAVFIVGHVRDPYVQSLEVAKTFEKGGKMVERWGYWRTKFNKTIDAIQFSLKDYANAVRIAEQTDESLENDARRLGGDDYVAIASLSARQAFGALEITIGKDSDGRYNPADILAFQKEISSNGDMSTVDVLFPQFPALAYIDPALLKYCLEPIFKYTESGLYPNQWTVHDLGRYPNATGHNDGKDEEMPVEEAGNMLIMALAYYQLSKDAAWLTSHLKIMYQWSSFLVKDGLVPATQLSTDDFAGKLGNQTNLALKAIVGIAAMSELAHSAGQNDEGSKLRAVAEDYVKKWTEFAQSKTGKHTKLAYQLEDSWGTLYNLFADRLLNLKLVPQPIYEGQDEFYPSVANEFGVPLDSRHTWAKTDWQMFAAGAAVSTQTRDLFLNQLVKYLRANRVNAGFPDLYETQTAEYPGRSNTSTWKIEFINRPVVGGHFSILALDKLNQVNGVKGNPFRNIKKPDSDSGASVPKKTNPEIKDVSSKAKV
ncbi:hypothetical protein O181_015809 [Austropuccinia psidii MF-1]|uniref:Glutaminase n=1 Tax=Austropuccinia psidii MF-1 TaxID=1389203 RepID=A0A9Q3GR68_9BASI|nr:hypothetical protein [Austropuccinia psidii MF-1]